MVIRILGVIGIDLGLLALLFIEGAGLPGHDEDIVFADRGPTATIRGPQVEFTLLVGKGIRNRQSSSAIIACAPWNQKDFGACHRFVIQEHLTENWQYGRGRFVAADQERAAAENHELHGDRRLQ